MPERPAPIKTRNINETRHDETQIQKLKELRPFQCNMLLIRETLRMLYSHSNLNVSKAYKQMGITTDLYTLLLDRGQISDNTYHAVKQALLTAGFPADYLKLKRAKYYRIHGIIKLQHDYFDGNAEKSEVCAEIRNSIKELFLMGEAEISRLIFVCYRIMNAVTPTTESSLFMAKEALHKVTMMQLDEKTIKSKEGADFLTALVMTINHLNEGFSETQQSVQNCMNTVTILTNYILASDITKADIQSKPCLDMIEACAKIIFQFQQVLLDDSQN